jgi:hypothetical protein
MHPILIYCPTTLEADAGGVAVEDEASRSLFLTLVPVRQIAAKEQSGNMASDMEVRTKQRGVIEFLHEEKKLLMLTFIDAC